MTKDDKELTKRLRDHILSSACQSDLWTAQIIKDAADRIDALLKENAQLKRDSKHLDKIVAQNAQLREALNDIYRLWTSSKFYPDPNPQTSNEDYLVCLMKSVAGVASETLEELDA